MYTQHMNTCICKCHFGWADGGGGGGWGWGGGGGVVEAKEDDIRLQTLNVEQLQNIQC